MTEIQDVTPREIKIFKRTVLYIPDRPMFLRTPIHIGGNMDIITMSSVVQHGLIARGRVFTVSVLLPDKPGELARVAGVIAEQKGNVIKLQHKQYVSINRNAAVELKITMEAFGEEHKLQIIEGLKAAGYDAKLIPTNI